LGAVEFLGDAGAARATSSALRGPRLLFALVMSHTRTCEIPGISAAGASPEAMALTPAADAEYIRYGRCRSVRGVPMSPGGLPTPALITRAALEAGRIPSMAISAGAARAPEMPHLDAGLPAGEDVSRRPAMSAETVSLALRRGEDAGRHASEVADCVIIGESVPGGTTTALGVMRALGVPARVSSSMPENPVALKERAVGAAMGRLRAGHGAREALAEAGDPMLAFVCAMAAAASRESGVVLAGGTQMLAALMLSRRICAPREGAVAVATTSYVTRDASANFAEVAATESIPAISVDPGLAFSRVAGLRAFTAGHAKEGAGAGGAAAAAVLGRGVGASSLCALAEAEYARALSHRD